jgi:hypothetical protein
VGLILEASSWCCGLLGWNVERKYERETWRGGITNKLKMVGQEQFTKVEVGTGCGFMVQA